MENDEENWFLMQDDEPYGWTGIVLLFTLLVIAHIIHPFTTDYFKRHWALWLLVIVLLLGFSFAFNLALQKI